MLEVSAEQREKIKETTGLAVFVVVISLTFTVLNLVLTVLLLPPDPSLVQKFVPISILTVLFMPAFLYPFSKGN